MHIYTYIYNLEFFFLFFFPGFGSNTVIKLTGAAEHTEIKILARGSVVSEMNTPENLAFKNEIRMMMNRSINYLTKFWIFNLVVLA